VHLIGLSHCVLLIRIQLAMQAAEAELADFRAAARATRTETDAAVVSLEAELEKLQASHCLICKLRVRRAIAQSQRCVIFMILMITYVPCLQPKRRASKRLSMASVSSRGSVHSSREGGSKVRHSPVSAACLWQMSKLCDKSCGLLLLCDCRPRTAANCLGCRWLGSEGCCGVGFGILFHDVSILAHHSGLTRLQYILMFIAHTYIPIHLTV